MKNFILAITVLALFAVDASAVCGRRAARKAGRAGGECTACAQAPTAATAAQVTPTTKAPTAKVAEGTPFIVPSRVATQTTFRLFSRSTSTCPNGQCPVK